MQKPKESGNQIIIIGTEHKQTKIITAKSASLYYILKFKLCYAFLLIYYILLQITNSANSTYFGK